MRQLLLLRHAKAAQAATGQDDRDRPLNEAGRAAIAATRARMKELGLAPDLVLVSPSRRTMETLEGLEPWDETPLVEPVDALYLAPASGIRAVLNGVAETVRSVLLIGHNPGLHDFAASLHDGGPAPAPALEQLARGFPTAALAEFSVLGPWWQLDARRARLVRFLSRKKP
ncbi:MAG TPA: histidine phosphatase family protein [Acetobacteraceae bacterium]|nr:histidine phosphatase family protein [Acetobacteraceae bacterium]